ncbi:glycosyltransferase family 4 protein [Candidatus Woesearchaeota archaeon]|nr:glycosyltransferase family 4 protein [Candidatus Woesearchaeota archaeon]
MKVLLITAYFKEEARGIPTSYKLARLLAEHGHEVVVLTSKAISRRTDEPHRNIKVIETKDLFIRDPLNVNLMPFLFRDLGRIIKKENPDVCIVSKYIFFPIICTPYLRMKGLPVIVITDTYPGVVWFVRNKLVNFMAWLYYHVVGRFFFKFADLVVLTHEEIIEATKGIGVKPNRFTVIHNGVDLKRIDAARPARNIKKGKDDVIVTFVGRLASIKGLDTLLEAAKDILAKPEHRNVRFLLVGDGDNRRLFRHKSVEYLGYRNDVVSIFKKSDIAVMPSISEGLPSAVIEAMSCGVPIVGSDIPGGMKVLVKDNVTGLRFRKGDSKDLAAKLEKLIKSKGLRQRLGLGARRLIEKDFNNDKIYNTWNNTLKRLVRR